MNQPNRSSPRNTEAYTKLFEKLSLSIEQGLAAHKAAKEKEKERRFELKHQQKAELERIRINFAELEDKARTFHPDELDQSLMNALDNHFKNKPNEPLTLFTHTIACSKNDPDLIAAKAFRLLPFSNLSIWARLYLIVMTLAALGLWFYIYTDSCNVRVCTTSLINILLTVFGSAFLALFFVGEIAFFGFISNVGRRPSLHEC